jgi:hypothetical protein
MSQNVLCQLPAQLRQLLASNPSAFNAAVTPSLSSSLGLLGMYRFGELGLGIDNIADFFSAFDPYYFDGSLGAVASLPVLVYSPALDTFTGNQSVIFWNNLVDSATVPLSSASMLLQSDPARGGGLHCDVGSTSNVIGEILMWVDSVVPAA